MVPSLSDRAQFVMSFLMSVVLGWWLHQRDGGEERIKSEIYSYIAAIGGLLVGSKLAQRGEEGTP